MQRSTVLRSSVQKCSYSTLRLGRLKPRSLATHSLTAVILVLPVCSFSLRRWLPFIMPTWSICKFLHIFTNLRTQFGNLCNLSHSLLNIIDMFTSLVVLIPNGKELPRKLHLPGFLAGSGTRRDIFLPQDCFVFSLLSENQKHAINLMPPPHPPVDH